MAPCWFRIKFALTIDDEERAQRHGAEVAARVTALPWRNTHVKQAPRTYRCVISIQAELQATSRDEAIEAIAYGVSECMPADGFGTCYAGVTKSEKLPDE